MEAFQPIESKSRIPVVDAIRGFALLGVLLANLPFDTKLGINTSGEPVLLFFYHVLIDKKFITIFSMLFGFGFGIQLERTAGKGIHFTSYFGLRMLLLFLIGSFHAFIIWNGDILRAYAVGGLLLLLVRNWRTTNLLVLAFVSNILLTGFFFVANSALGWQSYHYDPALAKELVLTTSFWDYLQINAIMDPWVNFVQDMPITLAFTFGNMLIGFVLGRIGFFQYDSDKKAWTNRFILVGLPWGIACSYLYYQVISGQLELGLTLIWLPFLIVTGILMQSLGYIALFMRLFEMPFTRRLLGVFIPVGKTALSNYLIQSLLFVFVFYHCLSPSGLLGTISFGTTLLIGLGFFALQILASALWLRKHRQGPIEYYWRKWSYRGAAKI